MLNAPRTIAYAFRVVALDGWVWLYDDSERTYICSATPMIWAEPLYPLEQMGDDPYLDMPEPGYWIASDVEKADSEPVPLATEEIAPDVSPEEAWDSARDEAQANCLI